MSDLAVGAVVLAMVATLAGATIQGAIGFGMNLLVVPVLALFLPETLPAAAICLGIPVSISMLRYEFDSVDRTGLGWIVAGRLPGTVIGVWLVAAVTTSTLQVMVACFVLLFVASSAVAPRIPVGPPTQLAAGAVSGVTGTAAGIGGPPVALLYQHHRGPVMRSTLAAAFFVGTFLSLGTLAVGGEVTGTQLATGLVLVPLVVVGSVLGRRLHGVLDRGWLRPAVLAFSSLSAAAVLVDALVW